MKGTKPNTTYIIQGRFQIVELKVTLHVVTVMSL